MNSLMGLIRFLIEKIIREGRDIEEVATLVDASSINLRTVNRELNELVKKDLIEQDEADTIRLLLAYIFIRTTDMNPDEVYSYLFSSGKRIRWQ